MKASRVFPAIFFGVFFLIGLAMLAFGLWAAIKSTGAANWPSVEGKLSRVELKENTSGDNGPTYEVTVEYTYTVDGATYNGSRLAFGYGGSSGREAHEEIYKKLKAAKSVDVRYDAADPATSTLSYGFHATINFILLFAFVWLTFIAGFTLMWFLTDRKDDVLLRNLSVK